MGFFDSDIVQQEAQSLFTDYQNLVQLGGDFGKFDREGKKMYISQMEAIMDRYKIFMKRLGMIMISLRSFMSNMRGQEQYGKSK